MKTMSYKDLKKALEGKTLVVHERDGIGDTVKVIEEPIHSISCTDGHIHWLTSARKDTFNRRGVLEKSEKGEVHYFSKERLEALARGEALKVNLQCYIWMYVEELRY